MPMNNRLLRPTTGLDPDAAKYLAAVEAADGEPLEPAVRTAINAFFRNLKATGQEYAGVYRTTFESLKACCILAGARTLAGALVPLKGDAPTAYGFTEGDYSRASGLTGDGSTTYLDSGRANDADPQDDKHIAAYATVLQSNTGTYLSSGYNPTSASILRGQGTLLIAFLNGGYKAINNGHTAAGFLGASRDNGASHVIRGSGLEADIASVSQPAPSSASIKVFGEVYSDATIAFYSIGTSLSLADLDTAVTNLITAIGEAL